MSDLRGFDAPKPETENGRGKSKIIAGAIVALMLGGAAAYVFASNNHAPAQQQKVAMNEPNQFNAHPQPLTPPPAPVNQSTDDSGSATTPDVAAPAAAPKPVEKAVEKTAPSASVPHLTREAHVRTAVPRDEPSTAPSTTPPDTTTTPELPSQPAAPQAIPQQTVTTPPPAVDQTPPSTTPQDGGTPQ
ncbi:MAG: hypothetical protein JOZ72_18210 [Alphaproteobacteria bacterium]|nr:hypothetical protein [Alphaproteobacteria bacterium]